MNDMSRGIQFTVPLANKPGQLSALLKLLADKKINLMGAACETLNDVGFVRFIVQKKEETIQDLLEAKGYRPVATPVFHLEVPNESGELAKVLRRFAEKGVNVLNLYATAHEASAVTVVFAVDQFEKAGSILK